MRNRKKTVYRVCMLIAYIVSLMLMISALNEFEGLRRIIFACCIIAYTLVFPLFAREGAEGFDDDEKE